MAKSPGKFSDFTKAECDYFRQNCNFTDEESKVFVLRTKNKSVVQICFELGMSTRTVDRRIQSVKKKIIKVL